MLAVVAVAAKLLPQQAVLVEQEVDQQELLIALFQQMPQVILVEAVAAVAGVLVLPVVATAALAL
jgi:hypothetical protein